MAEAGPEPDEIAKLAGRQWQHEKFTSRDSVVYLPSGATKLKPGGWDHEHCLLCWAVISGLDPARRWGYSDENDEWLCVDCFQRHIRPAQSRGPGNPAV